MLTINSVGNQNDINFDVLSFETKSRCERNLENVKKQLQEQGHGIVHTVCVERSVSKGK